MKMTRAYAPGGGERDADGTVMNAKIDLAHHLFTTGTKATHPISVNGLREEIIEYHRVNGKLPTKLHFTGDSLGTKGIGISTKQFGFIWIDYIPESSGNFLV